LKSNGQNIFYTPCDVSTAMVLVARRVALAVVPEKNCFPSVCDLATADKLNKFFVTRHPSLVTFFGMIPNFEPQLILPKLASLVRPKDFLLFSANLAPGKNYAAGMKKVLPQYDNGPTRDWLMTFLLDLGVKQLDGRLSFKIENGNHGLKRIVVRFHFARARRIEIEDQAFDFASGESIRLFFSYRYTPGLVRIHLARHGLKVLDEWTTRSEEEGVFLCRRK
jgi:L-histidine Nalpha-methyltransferase